MKTFFFGLLLGMVIGSGTYFYFREVLHQQLPNAINPKVKEPVVVSNSPIVNTTQNPTPAIDPKKAESTLIGEYICLPHKDTSGPQTLECALGLRVDNGEFYAMDTSYINPAITFQLQTGAQIKVSGYITPTEEVSMSPWLQYNIVGIVQVTKVEEL